MINNRQNGNGRRRGRTNGAPRPNGGGTPDRGSRLDNRARGNASQLHEKYKTLAADFQRQGDRVMTEYYLQFADHYFRVLSETRSRFDEQQQRRDRFDGQGDAQGDEDEGDYGDGGEERFDDRPAERSQPRAQEWQDRDGSRNDGSRNDGNRNEPNRNEGNRSESNRSEGNRSESVRAERQDNRQDAYRGDGNRTDATRGEGQRGESQRNEGQRGERQERGDERSFRQSREGNRGDNRADGNRDARDGNRETGRETGREQGEQRREPAEGREPRQPRVRRGFGERGDMVVPAASPADVALTAAAAATAGTQASYGEAQATAQPAPMAELPLEAPAVAERRPRGRPRKVVPVEVATEADAAPERIEMDRLPPSLSPAPPEGDEAAPRRRTRRPRGEATPAEA